MCQVLYRKCIAFEMWKILSLVLDIHTYESSMCDLAVVSIASLQFHKCFCPGDGQKERQPEYKKE